MEAIGNLIASIAKLGGLGILLILYIISIKLHMRLFRHWLEKRTTSKISLYIFITFFLTGICFFGSGLIALFTLSAKYEKERKKIYERVSMSPSDAGVDELMDFIKKYSINNTPNDWNQVRAVWFRCNESPNVTTEKKKELKNYLMLQGLRMHYKEAEVIDNYKR